MTAIHPDGAAMMQLVQARIAAMPEQDRADSFASIVLYLWVLSTGEKHGPEALANLLHRPALQLLAGTAEDIAAMRKAQGEP